jgi:hypothetical protein
MRVASPNSLRAAASTQPLILADRIFTFAVGRAAPGYDPGFASAFQSAERVQHGNEKRKRSSVSRHRQKEWTVADGTANREPSRPAARDQSRDRQRLGRKLRKPIAEVARQVGISGCRSYEHPDERLVELLNSSLPGQLSPSPELGDGRQVVLQMPFTESDLN